MRATLPVLLLAAWAAVGAAAQDTVPDTTAPARYAPMGLGDTWVYEDVEPPAPGPYPTYRYHRRTVVADSVVEGETYWVVLDQRFEDAGEAPGLESTSLLRYDSTTTRVVTPSTDPEPSRAYGGTGCRLDAPFGDYECASGDFGVGGGLGQTVEIGPDAVETSVKSFYTYPAGTYVWAAGIGVVQVVGCEGGCWDRRLVFARVGGETYGEEPAGLIAPDPTPPHLYYPLAVGNVWEYANIGLLPTVDGWYTRREIPRDTVIDGRRYFVEVRTRVDLQWQGWTDPSERLVRYDSASTQVMILSPSGTEWPLTCRFGADFGGPVVCGTDPAVEPPGGSAYVSGGLNQTIPLGRGDGVTGGLDPDSLAVMAVKEFSFPLSGASFSHYAYYAAPIGYAGETAGSCACSRNLTYARVHLDDGVYEVGERFAVAADERPEAGRLAVSAFPTPTAGPLALAVDVPTTGAVTLEAFDALGRHVWRHEVALGVGRQRVEIDAGEWAPGLYVVRVTSGGETATATVVRR